MFLHLRISIIQNYVKIQDYNGAYSLSRDSICLQDNKNRSLMIGYMAINIKTIKRTSANCSVNTQQFEELYTSPSPVS